MSAETEIVFDPYQGVDWDAYGQHKAQHHTHADMHDNDNHAHEVADFYDEAGFDILSVLGSGDNWPWTGWSTMDENWEDRYPIGTHGEAPDEDSKVDLIAIRGYESSASEDDPPHHVVVLFDYVVGATVAETLQAAEDADALAILAHPGRYFNEWEFREYLDWFDSFDSDVLLGFEITFKSQRRFPKRRINSRRLWDDVASWCGPNRPVFAMGTDDRWEDLDDPGSGLSLRRWNVVLLDDLTEANVRSAYENGHWYCVEVPHGQGYIPPTIDKIDHDESAKTIKVTASDYTEIRWLSCGNRVATGSTIDYGETAIGPTLRAVVFNDPGHEERNGPRAETQPYLANPYTTMQQTDDGTIRTLNGIDTTRGETHIDSSGRLSLKGDLDTTQDETQLDGDDLDVGGDYEGGGV